MKNLILLIMITSLNAESYPFIVENTTMVDVYFNVFNGMAALFQNETYLILLKLVFLLGGFFIFIIGIIGSLRKEKETVSKNAAQGYFGYMIYGVVLLTLMLYTPNQMDSLEVKTNALSDFECAETQLDSTGFVVNMPGILAPMFSTFNSFGTGLTDLASAIYINIASTDEIANSFKNSSRMAIGAELQTPIDLYKFRMIDYNAFESLENINTSNFGTMSVKTALTHGLNAFFEECLILSKAAYPETQSALLLGIQESGNIYSTIEKTFASNTKIVDIYMDPFIIKESVQLKDDPGQFMMMYNEKSITCRDFFNDVIAPAKAKIMTEDLGCNPSLSSITKSGLYIMSGVDLLAGMGGLSNLALQSAVLDSLNEADKRLSSDFAFTSSKTITEMALANNAQGQYMAKMLHYLQMGVRVILYAFFPFILIVMLFPGGTAIIRSYALSVLWVELWSPMAVIFNLFLSYYSQDKLSNHFQSGNITSLINDAAMLSGVAGYLYAMIPGLAWLVIKGSGIMLNGMLEGLATSYQKNFNTEQMMKDRAAIQMKEMFNQNSKTTANLQQLAQLQADSTGAQSAGNYTTLENSKSGTVSASYKQGASQAIDTIAAGQEYNANSKLSNGKVDEMASRKSFKAKTMAYKTDTFTKEYSSMHNMNGVNFNKIAEENGSIEGINQLSKTSQTQSVIETIGMDNNDGLNNMRKYVQGQAFNNVTSALKGKHLSNNFDINNFAKIKASQEVGQIAKFDSMHSKEGAAEQSISFYNQDTDGSIKKKNGFIDSAKQYATLEGQVTNTTAASNSLEEKLTKENELGLNIGASQKSSIESFQTMKSFSEIKGTLDGIEQNKDYLISQGLLNSDNGVANNFAELTKKLASNKTVSNTFNAEKTNQIISGLDSSGLNIGNLSDYAVLDTKKGIAEQNALLGGLGGASEAGKIMGENKVWNASSENQLITNLKGSGFLTTDVASNRTFETMQLNSMINTMISPIKNSLGENKSISIVADISGTLKAASAFGLIVKAGADVAKMLYDTGRGTKVAADYLKNLNAFNKENEKLLNEIDELEDKKKKATDKASKAQYDAEIKKKKADILAVYNNKAFVSRYKDSLDSLAYKQNRVFKNDITTRKILNSKNLNANEKMELLNKLNKQSSELPGKIETHKNDLDKKFNQTLSNSKTFIKNAEMLKKTQSTLVSVSESTSKIMKNKKVIGGSLAIAGLGLLYDKVTNSDSYEMNKAIFIAGAESIIGGELNAKNISQFAINIVDITSIITKDDQGILTKNIVPQIAKMEDRFLEKMNNGENIKAYAMLVPDFILGASHAIPGIATDAFSTGKDLGYDAENFYKNKSWSDIGKATIIAGNVIYDGAKSLTVDIKDVAIAGLSFIEDKLKSDAYRKAEENLKF